MESKRVAVVVVVVVVVVVIIIVVVVMASNMETLPSDEHETQGRYSGVEHGRSL